MGMINDLGFYYNRKKNCINGLQEISVALTHPPIKVEEPA